MFSNAYVEVYVMSKSYSVNVSKLLKKYNLTYKLSGAGKEVAINCLFHEDEKGKLSINTDTGLFHCWVCGEKGNFRELVKQIAKKKKTDISLSDFTGETKKVSQVTMVDEVKIPYPEGYDFLQGVAKEYILKRGITEEQIDYYRIGACYSGKLKGRVIVPVFNKREELVSYIARACVENIKPKVLTPPSLPGKHGVKDFVFNLYKAMYTKHLVITEGVFDAMKVGSRGICLFGKVATAIQLSKIINQKPIRVSIMLDNDAQLEANILAQQLTNHVKDVRLCSVPEGYDPGSATSEMIEEALKNYKYPNIGYGLDFIGI
jgi:DNA primase